MYGPWSLILLATLVASGDETKPKYNGKTAAEWTVELKKWHPRPDVFDLGPPALHAIISLGPNAELAVPTLIELLQAKNLVALSGATSALAAIGPRAQAATLNLAALVEDRELHEMIRTGAAHALAEIGPSAKGAKSVPGTARR
jgi:hypothetical protein